MLLAPGYELETPIPMITKEGVNPFPTTGYRQPDARTAFFYGVTGITPAMAMRLPGIGSTYLWSMLDSGGNYFEGEKTVGKTYGVHRNIASGTWGRISTRHSLK